MTSIVRIVTVLLASLLTMVTPATAGRILLSGSDADTFHVVNGDPGVAGFGAEVLSYLANGSSKPILVLGDSPATNAFSSGVGGGGIRTTSTLDGFNLSDFSALYILSKSETGSGCCNSDDARIAGHETAIIAYLASGGSLGIQNYIGETTYDSILGTSGANAQVFGHLGGLGLDIGTDGLSVTAAGMAAGFRPISFRFWGHQGYVMSFFGALGFVSFVDAPIWGAGIAGLIGKELSTCPVPPIAKITDPDAQRFEADAPNVPSDSLVSPAVEAHLDFGVFLFTQNISLDFGTQLFRTSGFRPAAYQAHLRELRDKWIQLTAAINAAAAAGDTATQGACQDLLDIVDDEIDVKHRLVRNPATEIPNVSANSQHSTIPASAIDLGPKQAILDLSAQINLDDFAQHFGGIARPCLAYRDIVHFVLLGTPCTALLPVIPGSTTWVAHSPINILVTDPLGRRVGFDAVTGRAINEVGIEAFYSGPNTEPQVIAIDTPTVGDFRLTALGVASGPYTIIVSTVNEDGEVIENQVINGIASPGVLIAPITSTVSLPIEIDIEPGSFPNVIASRRAEHIHVAILSTSRFLAPHEVDPHSVTFGRSGVELRASSCHPRDVNSDGLDDLVCRFRNAPGAFRLGDTEGILRGRTLSGTPFIGRDSVQIVRHRREKDADERDEESLERARRSHDSERQY